MGRRPNRRVVDDPLPDEPPALPTAQARSWPSRARCCPPARTTSTRSSSTASAASRSSTATSVFLQSRNGRPLRALLPRAALPAGSLRARRGDRRARRRRARGLRRARTARPPGGLARRAPLGRDARRLRRLRPARLRGRLAGWSSPSPSAGARALERLLGDPLFDGRPTRADGVGRIARARPSAGCERRRARSPRSSPRPTGPGERKGMVKVKRMRTIDAVVVGWRPGKEPDTVGALILGLYDGDELRVVGHCSGLTAKEKRGWSASSPRTRPASAARPIRAAGAPARDLEWVGAAPRARRGDRLRPRLRRAHPPRREAAALARRQARRASAPSTSSPAVSGPRSERLTTCRAPSPRGKLRREFAPTHPPRPQRSL